MKHSQPKTVQAIIYLEVPEFQIGQEVSVYFKDTMCMNGICEEPKTGHWEQYGNSWENKFKCSECGKEQPKILCGERIIGHWSDYCPNCGAKMESEET